MSGRRVMTLVLLAGVTGCTVGPDYVRPSPAALGVASGFGEVAPAATASVTDPAGWWQTFGDPVLDALIERARIDNTDVAAASARIRTARAAHRAARGQRLPGVSLSVSAGHASGSNGSAAALTAGSVLGASADADFDADLFGGLWHGIEAADADLSAANLDLDTVRATLAADLVVAYLDLRSAQTRHAIAADQLASQRRSAEIVAWRARAGLAAQGDYESVRALTEQTAATLPLFEEAARLAAHRLAILTGQAPSSLAVTLDQSRPLPQPKALPAIGIPADLLRRRPDVRAAERRLAAEIARIGVATAELYPVLRLTGSLAGTSSTAGALPTAALTTIAGALTAPLFQGGRIRARIEAQRGRADLALASYRATVLAALGDAEDALASLRTSADRQERLAAAADASDRALAQARGRYRGGLTDFQTLLDAERTLLTVRDAEAEARANHARAAARLFRALGGGWASDRGEGA